jgi:hypothetical protein
MQKKYKVAREKIAPIIIQLCEQLSTIFFNKLSTIILVRKRDAYANV